MKYKIKDMKLSETIKFVYIDEVKSTINVAYFDNTEDIFDLTKENYYEIKKEVEEQALKYIQNNQITDYKERILMSYATIESALLLIGFIILLVFKTPIIPVLSTFLIISSLVGIKHILDYTSNRSKEIDIEKYKLFFENKEKLEKDYQRIQEKEMKLYNKTNEEYNYQMINIFNLDNKYKFQIEDAIDKVERYSEIDTKVKKLRR